MTLRFRKPRRYLAAICALALAAGACGRLGQSLIELRAVRREMVRLAAGSNVTVRIANSKYLYISIANSPIRRLPVDEKAQKALEIARLGYASATMH